MSEFVLDAAVRHSVFVQRFAAGQAREAAIPLFQYRDGIIARLASAPEDFAEVDTSKLFTDINFLSATFEREFAETMAANSVEFAVDEAEFSKELLEASVVGVVVLQPSDEKVVAQISRMEMSPAVGAATISIGAATTEFTRKKVVEVTRTINDSLLSGQSTTQAASNINELMTHRQASQVDSLSKTTTNFISNAARSIVLQENQALFIGYEWVSVLDSRTTLICAGRDGNVYPMGKGPLPPAHWGCRSTTVQTVKPEFAAEKKTKGSSRPSTSDFGVWLKRQPAGFQDEYFSKFVDGSEKARLFRIGKLPIDRFRDELGAEYTLSELRALNPVAFQKAGIETIP